jgi:hypothetical protein
MGLDNSMALNSPSVTRLHLLLDNFDDMPGESNASKPSTHDQDHKNLDDVNVWYCSAVKIHAKRYPIGNIANWAVFRFLLSFKSPQCSDSTFFRALFYTVTTLTGALGLLLTEHKV